MILTNLTTKCFVFTATIFLLPLGVLEVTDDDYAANDELRFAVNRFVGDGSGDISFDVTPPGYPVWNGDEPAQAPILTRGRGGYRK